MYTATLTTNGTTNPFTGTVDEVTEWLATNHDAWDTETILSAMLNVLTYGSTRGDITTATGRFQVKEMTQTT